MHQLYSRPMCHGLLVFSICGLCLQAGCENPAVSSSLREKPCAGASAKQVEALRLEFSTRLKTVLADGAASDNERRNAAVLLGGLSEIDGPKYLAAMAISAGKDRDIERTFFWLEGLDQSAISDTMIRKLCVADDTLSRIAGSSMGAAALKPETVTILRRLTEELKDPRVVAGAIGALGRNGTMQDIVDMYSIAETPGIDPIVEDAARSALGAFLRHEKRMTRQDFLSEIEQLRAALKKVGAATTRPD